MDRDLMITRLTIQVAEERVVSQPPYHFINEGYWEMIFLSSFVELPIVNTHPPTSDSLLRNEFIFLIVDNSHSTLFQDHLY
jgi:hypothetical protein